MSDRPQNSDDDSEAVRGHWQLLVTVPSREEAGLIHGLLTSEGVESQIESLFFTQEPVNFGLLGSVRVWVPKAQLARAQQVLEARSTLADGEGEDEGRGDR